MRRLLADDQVHGYPMCCTSIGLAVGGVPVIGVIYNPFLDQLVSVPGPVCRCAELLRSSGLRSYSPLCAMSAQCNTSRYADTRSTPLQKVAARTSTRLPACLSLASPNRWNRSANPSLAWNTARPALPRNFPPRSRRLRSSRRTPRTAGRWCIPSGAPGLRRSTSPSSPRGVWTCERARTDSN